MVRQSGRANERGKLAARHIRNALHHSRVTSDGDRGSLTAANLEEIKPPCVNLSSLHLAKLSLSQ